MKRWAIILLAISLMLLSACGNGEAKAFINFASELKKADEISFNAELTAEYSSISADFELSFNEKDGNATIEIIKPKILKGIKAHLSDGSTELEFEGAMLDIGFLGGDLNPMSSLSLMRRAITDGHLDLAWEEDGLLCAQLIPEDGKTVKLWLDAETMTPVNAEISSGEKTSIFIEIHDWETK